MADEWKFDVPTTGTKYLPPDSRYMEALSSQGYGFEAAVADLVDNSIDAGAKDVIIHFLRSGDRLVSLLVVDDGCGMTEAELDVAMTVGGRRDYSSNALGMFGTGLKSASLSHAAAVTVVSRTRMSRPAGRRWAMEHALNGFQCDIVEPMYAQSLIDRYADKPITWQGTVIRWDGVKNFPQNGSGGQTDRYLQRTINKLGMHLGLQLHRFLERDDFNITVAVEDIDTGTIYMDFSVLPLNPFGYPVSGRPGYPRTFTVRTVDASPVNFTAHIWPPKSSLDQYRAIGSLMNRQGFYFYRHDRLVQAGGWNNFRQPEQHLSPARIAVDIPDGLENLIRLTVKKDGVDVAPQLLSDLEGAVDEQGMPFGQFIADAEATYRESRKRAGATRKPVIPPGRGVDPTVRETIEDELPVLPGEEPIDIRWTALEGNIFFDVDREGRTIYLNKRFRNAVLGGRRGGMNDAPMIKSLLYLLMHTAFEGERSGSREKDNLQLWQSILYVAANAEEKRLSNDG